MHLKVRFVQMQHVTLISYISVFVSTFCSAVKKGGKEKSKVEVPTKITSDYSSGVVCA